MNIMLNIFGYLIGLLRYTNVTIQYNTQYSAHDVIYTTIFSKLQINLIQYIFKIFCDLEHTEKILEGQSDVGDILWQFHRLGLN